MVLRSEEIKGDETSFLEVPNSFIDGSQDLCWKGQPCRFVLDVELQFRQMPHSALAADSDFKRLLNQTLRRLNLS